MSHDQSDWQKETPKDDTPPEQSLKNELRGRNTRGRPSSKPQDPQQSLKMLREEAVEKAIELDCSNWLMQGLKEGGDQDEAIGVRGQENKENMSFNLQGTEELQPDKQLDTTWLPAQKPATGGSHPHREQSQQLDKQQKPAFRRGNHDRNDNNTQQRKTPYQPQGDDFNRKAYNYNNREGEYRGRGRGQNRGGNRGQREGQEDYGGRRQGNEYYKRKENYEQPKTDLEEAEAPRRGNRGNRAESSYDSNYSNRGYNNNRDYHRPYNNNRNYNYQQNGYNGRNYNRDRHQKDNHGYNHNKDYQYNQESENRDKADRETRDSNAQGIAFIKKPVYSQKTEPEASNIISSKSVASSEKEKEEVLVPKGRRCWPESSIYVLGCRFSISFRPISEFRAKLLVIPYASLKMEYYPGNIINSSEVDYKARILAKGEQISSAGSIYLQKAISVGSFVGLAFLKVDQKRVDDSLKLGVKRLLAQVQKVEGPMALESLIFPICSKLEGTQAVINSFLQNLESCRRVKDVYVTTNQSKCFMEAMKTFAEHVQEMLDENNILIN